jgi:general secretion pathway protein M
MSALQQRWNALQSRERRVLAIGGFVLLAIIVYVALWEPLSKSRQDWRVRVAAAETDLAWMRAAAPRVRDAGAVATAPIANDGRSLLARVDASARDAGLGTSLLRAEPIAAGQVRVTFQQAGFDALMRWVETFSTQQAVRVGEFSVQRAEGVGLVDARLTLESLQP